MCYNYSLVIYHNQLEFEKIFGTMPKEDDNYNDKFYVNAFNIPKMPVITNEDPKNIQMYYWGLIPFWVKKENEAEKIRTQTMNVRAETIFEKPSFRNSIRNKRCLIPANGFFEWRYIFDRNYPYYIQLKNQKFFTFAGIWDSWYNSDTNKTIFTYSIITCKPNQLLKKIHNKKKRMPVILPINKQFEWINNNLTDNEINNFLVPYPNDKMEAYTISRLVTSKTRERNVPEVIEHYNYPELLNID